MNRFFELGNRYMKQSDWKDMALVKFCLCAMGIMLGTSVSKKNKDTVFALAGCVFLATYIPLMMKVFSIVKDMVAEEKAAASEDHVIPFDEDELFVEE